MIETLLNTRVDPSFLVELFRQTDSVRRGKALRSMGIYTQRPAEDGFFMVRIRIPRGDLTAQQLETISSIARDYGRGLADITVRQNIQLHWIEPASLPPIVEQLQAVGLSTVEPGGGSVRNLVSCPVSGLDENELFDTTPLVDQVTEYFTGTAELSGLPRKLKITISGCALRCTYPEIHDIGLFAERDRARNLIGFRARIGGGLSGSPRFSRDLGIIAEPDQIVELCAAVAAIFRDGERSADSPPGRVMFQVDESEIPAFVSEIEGRLGYRLKQASARVSPLAERDRSHLGVHGQKTPGLYYIGISILAGRTSAAELARLAFLARKYGACRVRTTNAQNIILPDVPESNLEGLARELDAAGLEYDPSWSRKGMIACTGIQFCKQAVAETKNRAAELTAYLEREVELDHPVRISVTGCPNCCGQHHICDVGLEGSTITVNGVKEESFQVLLGGGVTGRETLARRLGIRIPSRMLPDALRGLFMAYKRLRAGAESFQEFCARHTDQDLISFMA